MHDRGSSDTRVSRTFAGASENGQVVHLVGQKIGRTRNLFLRLKGDRAGREHEETERLDQALPEASPGYFYIIDTHKVLSGLWLPVFLVLGT